MEGCGGDIEEDADARERHPERGSPVTQEWQCNPCEGKHREVHGDIDERLNPDAARDPGGNEGPEAVGG